MTVQTPDKPETLQSFNLSAELQEPELTHEHDLPPLQQAEDKTAMQETMLSHTWIDQQEEEELAKHRRALNPLPLPKRQWVNKQLIRYKVYASETEWSIVEANSATRAIVASGYSNPYKVERYMPEFDLQLHEEETTLPDLHVDMELLDSLTLQTPVLSHQIVKGLEEAGEELEALGRPPSDEA